MEQTKRALRFAKQPLREVSIVARFVEPWQPTIDNQHAVRRAMEPELPVVAEFRGEPGLAKPFGLTVNAPPGIALASADRAILMEIMRDRL